MKSKWLMTAGAAVLSMGILAGCGAPTAEKLVDKMYEEPAESFVMDMEMDADVTAGVSGMSVNLTLGGSVEMEYDASEKDAPSTHVTTDLNYSAMGQKDTIKTEAYAITGEDEVVSYAKNPEDGTWIKSTAEVKENPFDEETREKMLEEIKGVFKTGTVEKKTQKVGSEECYVLKLNTTADAFSGILDIAFDAMGDEVEDSMKEAGMKTDDIVDILANINLDMTIYASKESGRCVQMSVDLAGTDAEGLVKEVTKMLADLIDMFGIDAESIELEIEALNFTATFSEWNEVEVEVPKKVEEEAVEAGGGYGFDDDLGTGETGEDVVGGTDVDIPDDTDAVAENPDGSVTLMDWMDNAVVDVFPRDGFELNQEYSNATYLSYNEIGGDVWDGGYSVMATTWLDWDDVVAEGDEFEDEDGKYYVREEEDGSIKMVLDLGIEHDGYPLYACVEGKMNESGEEFDYAWCYLCFEFSDDDDWVQVELPDEAIDWRNQDYQDVYNEIFQ